MKCLFRLPRQSGLVCLLALAVMPVLASADPAQTISPSARAEVQARYGQLPLSFEANQGQTDSQVKFLARGHGYGLFLTPTEAVLSLQTPHAKSSSTAHTGSVPEISGTVLRMQWAGGNSATRVIGREAALSRVNYLIGKDHAHWHTGVPTYARVAYEGVYPGVDLVYYGHQGQLEYDVVVAPKADPRAIRLAFHGADRMEVSAAGELVLHSGRREIQMHKPVIYQEVAGVRKSIVGGYTLNAAREVGFDVGAYDCSHPLVIDPVLAYATYLGGNGDEDGEDIAVDGTGHAYVTGYTSSANFPTTAGAVQPALSGNQNAFVVKLNATGTALDYATYLGGNGGEAGIGIAVDSTGHAYVTGGTQSANFPTTAGAVQPAFGGGSDTFVVKLNATGTAIDYATYLGGNGWDYGDDIAVDGTGHTYVTGYTASANFPTTAGAVQPALGGDYDVFVAKLNATGAALNYSTYLGGNSVEDSRGIAVDGSGHAYVTGYTQSANFPTTRGSFQKNYGGNEDTFVAKLNKTGKALDYATYLGGNSFDLGMGIAVDGTGHAYVTGATASANFPTTRGGFQPAFGGGQADTFVAKLNKTGKALNYATYLGGNSSDGGTGIAVDSTGHAYVTGGTNSANFPTTPGAVQPAFGGGWQDAFVAKLNKTGKALDYATYLGGSGDEYLSCIAVYGVGHAYVSGETTGFFPITNGAFQPAFGGGSYDAYVAKLDIVGPPLNKDQCKNGGWKTFNNPTFKNQDQCVRFVEHNNHDDEHNNYHD